MLRDSLKAGSRQVALTYKMGKYGILMTTNAKLVAKD